MMQFTRRKMTFMFTVMAVVLGTASIASACITQKGKFTVSVSETGSGRADGDTVIGNGSNHGWCQKAATSAAADVGDTLTYSVRPTVSGDCNYSLTNRLANGTYEVRVNNQEPDPYLLQSGLWEFQSGTGCYRNLPTVYGEQQGTMTVTSGSGDLNNDVLSLTGTPNYNGTSDASLVCVGLLDSNGKPTSNPGIFSPLRIINI